MRGVRLTKSPGAVPVVAMGLKSKAKAAAEGRPSLAGTALKNAGWVTGARPTGSGRSTPGRLTDFEQAQFTLARKSDPLSTSLAQVKALTAGRLNSAAVKTLHRNALTDLVRIAKPSQERGLQDEALSELRSVHGPTAGVIDGSSVRPTLEKFDEHRARALAATAVVTLHSKGVKASRPELLVPVVEQLGRYGRVDDVPTLERLLKVSTKAGDTATSAAAATAIAQLHKLKTMNVAMLQLEGGKTAGSGIKSYVNPTSAALAELGHKIDVYLPMTKDLAPEANGLKRIVGAEGHIRDVDNRTVGFHLWEGERITHASGGEVRFVYMQDGVDGSYSHFSQHSGIYDQPDGTPFASGHKRVMAGAALSNAAMSKMAAIRKLEKEGQSVTAATVQSAEQRLSPGDVPHVVQYNDSHFAFSYPMLQYNGAFSKVKPLGIIHQANAAYRPYVPQEQVEAMLRPLGGRFLKPLDSLRPGEYVDPLNVMGSLFYLSTVSPGYQVHTLHAKGEGAPSPHTQAILQEAYAGDRYAWVITAINLINNDPMNIAGTTQVAAFGLADLSGKAACQAHLQRSWGVPVDPRKTVMSFAHRMTREKGLGDLLRPMNPHAADSTPLDVVLKESPELQVLIGGPDPEAALLAMAKQLEARHPGRVKVLGERLNNREVHAGSTISLFTSKEEPFGIVGPEMLRFAAPPIYTNHQGPAAIFSPYNEGTGVGTGFAVVPNSPDSLLDGLRRGIAWARKPADERAQLQRNGMVHSLNFGIDRMALNHDALLREAATEVLR